MVQKSDTIICHHRKKDVTIERLTMGSDTIFGQCELYGTLTLKSLVAFLDILSCNSCNSCSFFFGDGQLYPDDPLLDSNLSSLDQSSSTDNQMAVSLSTVIVAFVVVVVAC